MTPSQDTAPVLVTGATGNVGSQLVELLLAAGVPVRAAAASVESVRARFGDRVQAVVLDFTDPSTWTAAYSGVRRMFLMRPPHLGKPNTQMLPSLEAAKAAGIEHVVLLSLQGAEHNTVVPHHALEVWLRESGLSWTFVRAAFFMQNLTITHLTDVRDRDAIMVPAGEGATAFVDVGDVAAVATQALLHPDAHHNTAWTPTGPQALTYTEIATILTEVLARPIRYARPGLLRYARHARSTLDMPWGMVGVTAAIYTIARLGRADGLTDDVLTVTGDAPTTFRAFAEREASAWALSSEPIPGGRSAVGGFQPKFSLGRLSPVSAVEGPRIALASTFGPGRQAKPQRLHRLPECPAQRATPLLGRSSRGVTPNVRAYSRLNCVELW